MFIKKTRSLLISLLVAAAVACPVFAAEPAAAELPVICKAEGIEETFTYRIEPLRGVQDFAIEKDTLFLKDNGSDMFRLCFAEPGLYSFRIRQVPGNDRNIKYDTAAYTADVHVFSGESGDLHAEVVVYAEGSGQKREEIAFVNSPLKETVASGREEIIKQEKENVRTGDAQEPLLYFGMCLFALFMILYVAVGKRISGRRGPRS